MKQKAVIFMYTKCNYFKESRESVSLKQDKLK